ncbi:caspase domain-containing protein [Tribonema minus]|uniref:Caspase domain-containing protein n=1 Tax=Tribonema minus TaxID=303371 RepID=A0A835YV30_9STRA|nr:caspase domain-containing protein [Tribonema minus]
MQRVLKAKRFKQVPQLSTSKVLDLQAPFEIMQPGGRHRSLLIGINYRGQRNELRGCHNDVFAMKRYITSQGFTETADTMCVLVDDGRHSSPTCATIVAGFRWLVDGARAGDSLFFHYSGHGGSVPDDNGDEADGMDETILPLDYLTAGQIRDDDIYKLLVKPLPHGVEFTIVMDCCHSGTIIDLPYSLSVDDELVHAMDAGQAVPQLKPNADFNMGKILGIGKHLMRMRKEGKTAMQIGSHAATALGLDKKLKKLGLGF